MARTEPLKLWSDAPRTLQGGYSGTTSSFEYLNRSARDEAAAVRALVEQMLDRYPAEEHKKWLGHFKSTDDGQHLAAFTELLVHELLLRQGHRILEIEPPLAHTTRQPDFWVESSEGVRFYVEVKVSLSESKNESSAKTRIAHVWHAINVMTTDRIQFGFRAHRAPSRMVSGKEIRKAVTDWLDGRTGADLATQFKQTGQLEQFTLDLADGEIDLTAATAPYDVSGRTIMSTGLGAIWQGSMQMDIREALAEKATAYGDLCAPYFVVVNSQSPFASIDNAVDACFGSLGYVFTEFETGQLSRMDNGSLSPGAASMAGVNGMLWFRRLTPWETATAEGVMLLNPIARHAVASNLFGLPVQAVRASGEVDLVESGKLLCELLHLPADWPETDAHLDGAAAG